MLVEAAGEFASPSFGKASLHKVLFWLIVIAPPAEQPKKRERTSADPNGHGMEAASEKQRTRAYSSRHKFLKFLVFKSSMNDFPSLVAAGVTAAAVWWLLNKHPPTGSSAQSPALTKVNHIYKYSLIKLTIATPSTR